MQHLLTPYAMPTEPFAWWEGAFTEQQLDWLQEQVSKSADLLFMGPDCGTALLGGVSTGIAAGGAIVESHAPVWAMLAAGASTFLAALVSALIVAKAPASEAAGV